MRGRSDWLFYFLMAYQDSIEWLFNQVPMFQNVGAKAYKPGLCTTLALAAEYGNPHKSFPTIHIAGTNGKGSTAHTIAAVLQAAGYKVGLYTSPHLVDFRERIRVNGVMADRDFVEKFIEDFRASMPRKNEPSFFELTTVMAFRYFADCGVDVAVVETGLGGRLDSTNIISPALAVITNISLDHTALLGKTEEEIAVEKAGIIKPMTPVVIGNAAGGVRKVFEDKAAQMRAPILFACDKKLFTPWKSKDKIIYAGTPWGEIEGELTGDCQVENAATVMTALGVLHERFSAIDEAAVARGFAEVCELTGLMGRWMTVKDAPVCTVCDTGHNIGGWHWLGPKLREISVSEGTLRMVVGFVNDKDVAAIMAEMPRNAVYYFATPSVNRGRTAESTLEAARAAGLDGRAFSSVREAYAAAVDDSGSDDTVFVGGSTFIVADFLSSRS